MSWLVREAESRDELLTAAATSSAADGAYVALPLRRENSALDRASSSSAPRRAAASRRHGAATRRCDAIGLALAPRPRGGAAGRSSAATALS